MPVVRYLVGVGGALLALLLIANIYLPKSAELPQQQRAGIDKSTIRITSTQRGPERVEIDTSLPTIVPPTDVALAQSRPIAGTVAQAAPREAFAQMETPANPPIKPAVAAPKKHKTRVAHADSRRSLQPARMAAAAQPSFFGGLFGSTW